jgi:hypothetical protein
VALQHIPYSKAVSGIPIQKTAHTKKRSKKWEKIMSNSAKQRLPYQLEITNEIKYRFGIQSVASNRG